MKVLTARVCPDLVMQSTQQLCEPVKGLEFLADPHKIQPLQPETHPAITRCTAGRKERRKKSINKGPICASFIGMWYFYKNSQQRPQHTGERGDSYSAGNTKTDIIVEYLFWWTSKWPININSEHTMWTKKQQHKKTKDRWLRSYLDKYTHMQLYFSLGSNT